MFFKILSQFATVEPANYEHTKKQLLTQEMTDQGKKCAIMDPATVSQQRIKQTA